MMEVVPASDRGEIIDFLSRDPALNMDDARFCIEKSDSVIVCRDDSLALTGCGAFRLWGKEKDRADAYVYVAPEARFLGIGGRLLAALTNAPERAGLSFISTRIETNHSPSLDFFHRAGFEKWYTELILRHSGQRQPESGLNLIAYRDEYFERYVDGIQRSFFELRKSNDFQPYICCQPDEAKRNELARNKDHVYLLLDGESLVASVTVGDHSIEDVFVVPGHQGSGLGRKLMQFALNRAIDSGNTPVLLSAIEWNKRALSLYESVGFRVDKTIHFLRSF